MHTIPAWKIFGIWKLLVILTVYILSAFNSSSLKWNMRTTIMLTIKRGHGMFSVLRQEKKSTLPVCLKFQLSVLCKFIFHLPYILCDISWGTWFNREVSKLVRRSFLKLGAEEKSQQFGNQVIWVSCVNYSMFFSCFIIRIWIVMRFVVSGSRWTVNW